METNSIIAVVNKSMYYMPYFTWHIHIHSLPPFTIFRVHKCEFSQDVSRIYVKPFNAKVNFESDLSQLEMKPPNGKIIRVI